MKPSEILKQLNALREQWSDQSFSYTKEQQAEYNRLIGVRRERVKYFYDNGLVFKGGSSKPNVNVT